MTIFSNSRDQLHLVQCFSVNTFWMQMASTYMHQSSHTLTKIPSKPFLCTDMVAFSSFEAVKTTFLFAFRTIFRPTTHLRNQILRWIMTRITWNQCIPGKVASVKGKVSILFTSGFRFVNVYMYQIVLWPLIDVMLFAWVLQEFQTNADHTQDVGN